MSNEPATRVELVTPSLPRKCSTTELRRLLSGRRGSNPLPKAWKAFALPNELLPQLVGEGGLEPPNSSEDRFTVCCNCRYATPPTYLNTYFNCEPAEGFGPPTPRLQITCSTAELCRQSCQDSVSRQRDLDPRPRDYKSRALPLSYAGLYFNELRLKKAHHFFIAKWCAKLQLFYLPTTFFYKFFEKFLKKTVKSLCINT